VLAGLCLLSIPLRKLTSAAPVLQAAQVGVSEMEIPAVLRVKLLAPAQRLLVKNADGTILLDMPTPPAGESEHDVVLRLADGALELSLAAEFGVDAAETAVFLTVMPDGHEEQTRFMTGSGLLDETLHYEWRHAH